MKNRKKENDPNTLIEKQKFYISEFEQEAAWLSFMHKEGWKFVSSDGFHYQFEKTEQEDWCYQLDYKENGIAEDDYIQMYQDYGWEYISQCNHWFYFRKKRVEGEETDTTLFGDRESKLELCKRIVHGQFLRMLPLILLFPCFTNLLRFYDPFEIAGPVFGTFLSIVSVLSICIFIIPFVIYINQITRLNKLINELEGTK